MELAEHSYANKPSRYYIDGKRVSYDHYDYVRILARISGWQHCCFLTRSRKAPPGEEHYVHTSSINGYKKEHYGYIRKTQPKTS